MKRREVLLALLALAGCQSYRAVFIIRAGPNIESFKKDLSKIQEQFGVKVIADTVFDLTIGMTIESSFPKETLEKMPFDDFKEFRAAMALVLSRGFERQGLRIVNHYEASLYRKNTLYVSSRLSRDLYERILKIQNENRREILFSAYNKAIRYGEIEFWENSVPVFAQEKIYTTIE